jgi:phosphoribosylglycinamide formyltransferase-1
MFTIGILASHTGTTAQAVIDGCRDGLIAGAVGVVISNNEDSVVLDRARRNGIPAVHLSRRTHPDPAELDAAITRSLEEYAVDVVLLAGYLCKVGPVTLSTFAGRILNTHPALLPRHGGQGMFGSAAYEAVLASGDAETGATVHIVTDDYDSGPILAQKAIAIEPSDGVAALQAKVQRVERGLLIETIARIARNELALGN